MKTIDRPAYLQPYLDAARSYGAGFGTLLWASPKTQAARFSAISRAVNLSGVTVLDVGCGRADLLNYLLDRGITPSRYIGLEAIDALAVAAELKRLPRCEIIRGDFVRDPGVMNLGADVIVFSGSLNTLGASTFCESISAAYESTAGAVVFNFLASASLAAKSYLTWHRTAGVLDFARTLSTDVSVWEDYLNGDATVALRKSGELL